MSALAKRRLRSVRGFPAGIPYGFRELKSLYPRLFARALLIAMALHVSVLGTASIILSLRARPEPRMIYFPRPAPGRGDTLVVHPLPPPPMVPDLPAAPPSRRAPVDVVAAIPDPVPDTLVTTPATVPSIDEWGHVLPSVVAGDGGGEEWAPEETSSVGTTPGAPPIWVAVEKMPVLVGFSKPVYPPIAREAGVEGTVLIRAVIGADGRVESAQVIRGIPLLDEAALASVRAAVFTPGIQANKPVRVSVDIPITFRLQ